jgi:hypothetical protein
MMALMNLKHKQLAMNYTEIQVLYHMHKEDNVIIKLSG